MFKFVLFSDRKIAFFLKLERGWDKELKNV